MPANEAPTRATHEAGNAQKHRKMATGMDRATFLAYLRVAGNDSRTNAGKQPRLPWKPFEDMVLKRHGNREEVMNAHHHNALFIFRHKKYAQKSSCVQKSIPLPQDITTRKDEAKRKMHLLLLKRRRARSHIPASLV